MERMCEIWEPSTRCTLQHWLHRNTPLLMDAHVGSGTEEGNRRARSHNKNVLAAAELRTESALFHFLPGVLQSAQRKYVFITRGISNFSTTSIQSVYLICQTQPCASPPYFPEGLVKWASGMQIRRGLEYSNKAEVQKVRRENLKFRHGGRGASSYNKTRASIQFRIYLACFHTFCLRCMCTYVLKVNIPQTLRDLFRGPAPSEWLVPRRIPMAGCDEDLEFNPFYQALQVITGKT